MKGNWRIGAIAVSISPLPGEQANHSRARRKAHALNDTDTEETTDPL